MNESGERQSEHRLAGLLADDCPAAGVRNDFLPGVTHARRIANRQATCYCSFLVCKRAASVPGAKTSAGLFLLPVPFHAESISHRNAPVCCAVYRAGQLEIVFHLLSSVCSAYLKQLHHPALNSWSFSRQKNSGAFHRMPMLFPFALSVFREHSYYNVTCSRHPKNGRGAINGQMSLV